MKRRSAVKAMALSSFSTPFFFSQGFTSIKKLLEGTAPTFKSDWESWPDIKWIGPEFWGNRLQDWEIIQGRMFVNEYLLCLINKADVSPVRSVRRVCG